MCRMPRSGVSFAVRSSRAHGAISLIAWARPKAIGALSFPIRCQLPSLTSAYRSPDSSNGMF